MEYYDIDSPTFQFSGYYRMKNGFGDIIKTGTHRNEIPLDALPVFDKCPKFGHNQNKLSSKRQIGWINPNAEPKLFPILTRYDARRAKSIISKAKKPCYSMSQLVFNIVNSNKNIKNAKSAEDAKNAKEDVKSDIFNFWNIFG